MSEYPVIVEKKGEKSFSAYSPDLPNCTATGETVEDALREMEKAIKIHLKRLKKAGEPVPEPTAKVEYIKILI